MEKILLAAVAACFASSAFAGETYIGFGVTSDYIASGATQTMGNPAFQPYIEYEHDSGFYAGVWASNVDFGGPDTIEADIYAGYRASIGDFGFDLGYYRYLYDADPAVYQEVIAKFDLPVSDKLGFTVTLASDLQGKFRVKDAFELSLPQDFAISGSFEGINNGDQLWDLGVSKALSDTMSIDGRYYGANNGLNVFAVSFSFDTTLNALMNK